MALTPYEEKVWEEVEQYFSEPEESAFGRFSRTVFKPVELVADRVIPERVLELVGDGVEKGLGAIGSMADRTVTADDVLGEFRELGVKADFLEDLNDADFRIMDDVGEAAISRNTLYALVEGAGCGAGGLALLAADIPLLLGLSFRIVRKVGICYGFDCEDPGEKAIAFKVFELAMGGTRERYDKLLELEALSDELDGLDPKERAEKAAVMGALLASREFVKKLAASLLSRKLAQGIPLIGGVIGGGFNFYFVRDVGHVAQQVYRRRVLARRRSDGEDGGAATPEPTETTDSAGAEEPGTPAEDAPESPAESGAPDETPRDPSEAV